MRTYQSVLAGVVVVLLAWVAGAQDPAPTTADRLTTATLEYEKAQAELSDVLEKLKVAVGTIGTQRLEKAQETWVEFRDAQAAFNCFQLAGSPYERMQYFAELRKETTKRTRELRQTHERVRRTYLQQ